MPAGPVRAGPPVQPPAESQAPEEEPKDEAAPAKPVVGIIYPTPEVRNVINKPTSFVARNGSENETGIGQDEINNPKFRLWDASDP